MKDSVKKLAKTFQNEVVECRRHLHSHPELSFQEVQTSQFVVGKLQSWGIDCQHGMAGTGVVGLLKGKKSASKKVVALRADMDALPILEANDVSYCSQNEGVMHACGHDVHTASLLGAARILKNLEDKFSGTIKLIFQPGEEKLPGGASLMIKEGVLRQPTPTSIFGQHVHPPLRAGVVGFKSGMYMASADEIYVTVKGRGGHGAMPQECVDPIAVTGQILVALQQLVSRMADPGVPSVLTFGKIQSTGGATNVIPNEVKLEGTFRTMNEKWRIDAHKKMRKMAEGIAKSMGAACDFLIVKGYPVLFNHEKLTESARKSAIEFLGKNQVVELPMRMTAEDFAYFSQEMPACFYRLGTGNPELGITSPIHTNTFDIDEDALETGTGLMAWLALEQLK